MDSDIAKPFIILIVGIIVLAILATLVSKQSQTASLISSLGSIITQLFSTVATPIAKAGTVDSALQGLQFI